MWPLVTNSNYLETVSTVVNQTHFQVAMFAFNTILLYGSYNMCSTWFLDIRISTYFPFQSLLLSTIVLMIKFKVLCI